MNHRILHNIDLQDKNTLALSCIASDYVVLDKLAQLEPYLADAKQRQLSPFILSGGSNLLLPAQLKALVIDIQLKGISIDAEDDDKARIKVMAGENWHDFVCQCTAQGYYGLENLALIPGRVGAAPIQNIGAYGVEVGEFIHCVYAYDTHTGQPTTLTASQCQFAYRDSIFKQSAGRYIIYAVEFELYKTANLRLNYADVAEQVGDAPTAEKLLATIIAIRQAKLPNPAACPNAGSFFKNPLLEPTQFAQFSQAHPNAPHYLQANGQYKIAAGWLIEQAGWKGKSIGQIGMYANQALVLVNLGENSQLTDIQQIYRQVQLDVWQKFAIFLVPEPILVSEDGQYLAHA